MSLAWKVAVVLILMVAAGVLKIIAHRKNFEAVRRHYTTRRTRVPVQRPADAEAPPAVDPYGPTTPPEPPEPPSSR